MRFGITCLFNLRFWLRASKFRRRDFRLFNRDSWVRFRWSLRSSRWKSPNKWYTIVLAVQGRSIRLSLNLSQYVAVRVVWVGCWLNSVKRRASYRLKTCLGPANLRTLALPANAWYENLLEWGHSFADRTCYRIIYLIFRPFTNHIRSVSSVGKFIRTYQLPNRSDNSHRLERGANNAKASFAY